MGEKRHAEGSGDLTWMSLDMNSFHGEIVAAVDSVLPVHKVTSIDEMFCKLGLRQRGPDEARAVARKVKTEIHDRVGKYLHCSIGLAPNRFLAKTAGKMQKPDGLTALSQEDLPPSCTRSPYET